MTIKSKWIRIYSPQLPYSDPSTPGPGHGSGGLGRIEMKLILSLLLCLLSGERKLVGMKYRAAAGEVWPVTKNPSLPPAHASPELVSASCVCVCKTENEKSPAF